MGWGVYVCVCMHAYVFVLHLQRLNPLPFSGVHSATCIPMSFLILSVTSAAGWMAYSWSVTPSLIAWTASLLPPIPALSLLTTSFVGVYAVDLWSLAAAGAPLWYIRLRLPLSILASSSLGFTLYQIQNKPLKPNE